MKWLLEKSVVILFRGIGAGHNQEAMLHRIIGFTLLQFFIVSVSSYVNQRNSFAVECPELLFRSVFTYE